MIGVILGEFWQEILAALGIVLALFVGNRSGRNTEKKKQAEKRLADMKKAQEVRDDVEALDDAELAERARRWVQDDD